MDYKEQLKLQAYLDGELPEAEAREVANWLARDQGAVGLLAELRNTRKAVAGFEDGIRLPEAREFYWSKIQREIERLEPTAQEPEPTVPFLARLGRYLVPATAMAILALVGLVTLQRLPGSPEVSGTETSFADAGALTFHDYSAGATLVWLPYPADNEITQEEEMGVLE